MALRRMHVIQLSYTRRSQQNKHVLPVAQFRSSERRFGISAGLRHRRAWVQIAAATLSGNSLRQTVHTHCASVHQAAKLVAAL